jgi:hypothetical protein
VRVFPSTHGWRSERPRPKRNLLEARVVITTQNRHVRFLPPGALVGWHHQLYSGLGADIVMESITLIDWIPTNLRRRVPGKSVKIDLVLAGWVRCSANLGRNNCWRPTSTTA